MGRNMSGFDPYAIAMIVVFVIGYFLITIESITQINKATIALMMAIICWILKFADHREDNLVFLGQHLANISQVIFFLIGALSVVEIINVHKGFRLISNFVKIDSKRLLLWVLGIITFFLSAVLDNLTTTIVMVTLLCKLVKKDEDRLIIGGGIVIAANAGGAWTPIGDVTTTMLWIGGQVSSGAIMKSLLLPSIVCLVVSLFFLSFLLSGSFEHPAEAHEEPPEPLGTFIFLLGIGSLVFVPIFKTLTGLPPFMGVLFGLSLMWLVTDLAHSRYDGREHLRVPYVFSRIDLSSTLFFLGILLSVNALESEGILSHLASWLDRTIGNITLIAAAIGLASAVVDNVPLVAATMGMYDLSQFPMDSTFWQMVAYCAGTGGSILIIGSAAGVVFMSMEKVDFFWYVKRISLPALMGYLAGLAVFHLL